MKGKAILIIILIAIGITITGCGSGGPSKAEAAEVVYGVYLREASILKMQQCELTPEIIEEGTTNVWLISYRFKDKGNDGVVLIKEGTTEEYPWEIYMIGMSEEVLNELCP